MHLLFGELFFQMQDFETYVIQDADGHVLEISTEYFHERLQNWFLSEFEDEEKNKNNITKIK